MNKPAFCQWAGTTTNTNIPAMESFGDMLGKLKSLFKPDKKPSQQLNKERREYLKQLRNFIKVRYGNAQWLDQQIFKTEKIDIGGLNFILELKGSDARDVLTGIDKTKHEITNICTDFKKYFKEREKKHIEIATQLGKLENSFDWNKGILSQTSAFTNIVKEYEELPFPFEQMEMSNRKIHGINFVPKDHTYHVEFDKHNSTKYLVNPLTKEEVLKFANEIDAVLNLPSLMWDIAAAFDAPSDQHMDEYFKLDESKIWEKDKKLASFYGRLCWDGDINKDREFFDGVLGHHKDGWTAKGGLIVYVYDMAYSLEKVITMSIK